MMKRWLSTTATNISQSQSAATANLKKTAQTVTVSLNRLGIEAYEDEERVKPTRTGYIPANDPAYDSQKWTEQMDSVLTKFAMSSIYATEFRDFSPLLRGELPSVQRSQGSTVESADGPSSSSVSENLASEKLTSEDVKQLFKGLNARDLRIRWETMLKPRRMIRQKLDTEHLRPYKFKKGLDVAVVDGRWCAIATGTQTPMPADYIPIGQSHQHIHATASVTGDHGTSVMLSSGISSLELQVQKLQEQEDDRMYALNADKQVTAEQKTAWRHASRLSMDNVAWTRQEDLVLREAVELFGQSQNAVKDDEPDRFSDWLWDRVAVALKARKRSPDECRERMLQLSLE